MKKGIAQSRSLLASIKARPLIKRLTKTRRYGRWRQYFPMVRECVVDDGLQVDDADRIKLDWPPHLPKPVFGIVQDYGRSPKWTKYRRFLRTNGFEYGLYNIRAHDWLERARAFDCIVGACSCSPWDLQEVREKYYFLERFWGKKTYPSPHQVFLYEDKKLEAYLAEIAGVPFAPTHISFDRDDALQLVQRLKYPLVSKIVPTASSEGVEFVRNLRQARQIIREAFSVAGRKSYHNAFRQKNYIYFQDFIPNDGYDIRVIVIGNLLSGYYRRVPRGDFRASGMGLEEKRALPEAAMNVALGLNRVVGSPLLVVDLVHALTGEYVVIEYSPLCQVDAPGELHVAGTPGVYIWDPDTGFEFRKSEYWVDELALREFVTSTYLCGSSQPAIARATPADPRSIRSCSVSAARE